MLKLKFSRHKRQAFTNEDKQCVNLTILSDNVVENTEVFLAQLSTDDLSVILNPDEAEIFINDNDCKFVHAYKDWL